MQSRLSIFLILVLNLVLSVQLNAQELEAISWSDLNSYEQEILSELETDWNQLPAVRQHQLQRGAKRWLNRTIDKQGFTGNRFRQLMELDPDARDNTQSNYDQFSELSEEEQTRIRDAQRRFNQLNAEERREIRRRFDQMTPKERRQFERLRRVQAERQRERVRDNVQEQNND